MLDRRARRVEAAVEEDRAEQRLERVGEDRRPLGAAAPALALAEAQRRAERELRARAVQRVAVDQVARAGATGRPPAGRGKRGVELGGDDAVEHGVADELEPLVVGGAVAAVGQRLREQRGSRNAWPRRSRKRRRAASLRRGADAGARQRDAVASNSISRLTLPTRCSLRVQATRGDDLVAVLGDLEVAARRPTRCSRRRRVVRSALRTSATELPELADLLQRLARARS